MTDTREALRQDFLNTHGLANATRSPLAADASTRRYERIDTGTRRVMFMDAPKTAESAPCPPDADEATRHKMGWNAQSRLAACRVEAFVAMSDHLTGLGLSAPKIEAFDTEHGFALIEDLGNSIYARVIEQGEDEIKLYEEAAKALAIIHQAPLPDALSAGDASWPILSFDKLALSVNADLFIDWIPRYDANTTSNASLRQDWDHARDNLIDQALKFPRALIMRDYHAENLLWLPQRDGVQRVGLLDFQDAVKGWAEWDFAMLLQDARRNVSPDASNAAIKAYLDETGGSKESFDEHLAVLGALNALRVAGVFARLVTRDNKEKYNAFQPRQLQLLAQNLTHPALKDMRSVIQSMAPHIVDLAS